jgi:hypothetical protein
MVIRGDEQELHVKVAELLRNGMSSLASHLGFQISDVEEILNHLRNHGFARLEEIRGNATVLQRLSLNSSRPIASIDADKRMISVGNTLTPIDTHVVVIGRLLWTRHTGGIFNVRENKLGVVKVHDDNISSHPSGVDADRDVPGMFCFAFVHRDPAGKERVMVGSLSPDFALERPRARI